jgi:dienelactone hydrolase
MADKMKAKLRVAARLARLSALPQHPAHRRRSPLVRGVINVVSFAATLSLRALRKLLHMRGSNLVSHTSHELGVGIDCAPRFAHARLFAPKQAADGPLPAVVCVHGFCGEATLKSHAALHVMNAFLGTHLGDWTYMQDMAELLAAEGFVVLMIGMPDNDQSHGSSGLRDWAMSHVGNGWPARDYSLALNEALDHLALVTREHLGQAVDPDRTALVGHSMGGAGVLYAASAHCRERVAAVVALNPAHMAVETHSDHLDECSKYTQGADFSGEFGVGELPHLRAIRAPTLVVGSVAEYNTDWLSFGRCCPTWPSYECVVAQVGAQTKELFVDGVCDPKSPEDSGLNAHVWLVGAENMAAYADGATRQVVCSFLRRHVLGSGEAAPARPANAHFWQCSGDALR